MKKRDRTRFLGLMVLVILGSFIFSAALTHAKSPEGELKEAIHWAVSADWFDPATGNAGALGWFALSVLHDSLVKPMPEGTYTPCLAESYSNSPDFKSL